MLARIHIGPLKRALIVEKPHSTLDEHLAARGISCTRLDAVANEQDLINAINKEQIHVLFKRSRVPVTRSVLAACPSLHAIQLCCIGSDSVDLGAAAEQGVMVFNDPVSNARSVVELVVGHLIALCRRLYETDVQMHENHWEKNAIGRYEILGKTLGVVGLGNIGRQVARVATALGMRVRFYDNRLVAQEVGLEMGYTMDEDLTALFRNSDMVTIHTSAKDHRNRSNEGFLDDVLGQLGADLPTTSPRIYLNLARGNLHSSDALLNAVNVGAIRRAAVDVYTEEPRPGATAWSNPYAGEPKITCTPHIGAATQEAQPRIARRVASTILAFSEHGSIRDCVYGPRIHMEFGEQSRGNTILAVVHSVSRGTKKAVDDAIFEAEANNLGSMHRDFPMGVAYDLSLLDRPLKEEELAALVTRASELSGDLNAIRSIRQVVVPT